LNKRGFRWSARKKAENTRNSWVSAASEEVTNLSQAFRKRSFE
jgi:hypothetical protein